jgi:soluble P-type ATPase
MRSLRGDGRIWRRRMIFIQRPGQDPLEIEFILIDFEGTLASDRRVHPKAKDKINLLSKRTKIYILTKEDKEVVEESLRRVKAEIFCSTEGETSQRKLDLLHQMGATKTVVIGNGLDDAPMMEEAGLSMCVISKEGASAETVKKADIVVSNVIDALDFLLKPLRQKATLGL